MDITIKITPQEEEQSASLLLTTIQSFKKDIKIIKSNAIKFLTPSATEIIISAFLAIHLIKFLACSCFQTTNHCNTFLDHFTLNNNAMRNYYYYVFITNTFNHSSFEHLLRNMICFYFVGKFLQYNNYLNTHSYFIISFFLIPAGNLIAFLCTILVKFNGQYDLTLVNYQYADGSNCLVYGFCAYLFVWQVFSLLVNMAKGEFHKQNCCEDCACIYEICDILQVNNKLNMFNCEKCIRGYYLCAIHYIIDIFYMFVLGFVLLSLCYQQDNINFYANNAGAIIGILLGSLSFLFSFIQDE